jgi:nucleoside-diphosphate-sugar epimerase
MRVLLFGGTGNLGSRCIQALLAHGHTLIVYVRNTSKLKSMVTPAIIDSLEAIVVGDATDPEGIKRALREHNIEAIVDVAGNQVLPWQEYLLPKIAKAVTEAAIAVGKERGEPLRAWITTGPGGLKIPDSEYLVYD